MADTNLKCTGITLLLVTSIILGLIGLGLTATVILAIVGLPLCIISFIFVLVAFIMALKMLYKARKNKGSLWKGFKSLTPWCKFNLIICLIMFIIVFAGIINGSVKLANEQRDPLITPEPVSTVDT